MESNDAIALERKPGFSLADWLSAAVLGVVSAVLYFASMANYAFPGTSAQLTAAWRGLDPSANKKEVPVRPDCAGASRQPKNMACYDHSVTWSFCAFELLRKEWS